MTKPKKSDLDCGKLRNLLDYNPDSGLFVWKVRRGQYPAGTTAGTLHKQGYVVIYVENRSYLAHRLAWYHVTGAWPKEEIDHANGVKNDNRFSNLREATRSQNQFNIPRMFGGVYARGDRWVASIKKNGKTISLGSFSTREEAKLVRDELSKVHYGEFCNSKDIK